MSALDDVIEYTDLSVKEEAAIELAKLRDDWLAAIKANNEVAKINADLVEALDEARRVIKDAAISDGMSMHNAGMRIAAQIWLSSNPA